MTTLAMILNKLKLDMPRFREMCIITGTDYNNHTNNYNIYYYYDIYKKGGKITMSEEEKVLREYIRKKIRSKIHRE